MAEVSRKLVELQQEVAFDKLKSLKLEMMSDERPDTDGNIKSAGELKFDAHASSGRVQDSPEDLPTDGRAKTGSHGEILAERVVEMKQGVSEIAGELKAENPDEMKQGG